MIQEWPKDIYDISAVIFAIQSELDRSSSLVPAYSKPQVSSENTILMECLAELFVQSGLLLLRLVTDAPFRYISNRQPGKALPFFLRLRRPNVFDLIREHNLFTSVQDQALLLVEFDQELMTKRENEEKIRSSERGAAIMLLVDHTHSIPVSFSYQVLQHLISTRCR